MAEQQLRIQTLSGGVSRLPDSKRLPTEAQELDNAWVSPEKSLQKRSPFTFIPFPDTDYLQDTPDPNDLWFTTSRDDDEFYLFRISDTNADPVSIWNVETLVPQTVTLAADTENYLKAGSGAMKDKIGHISIGDGVVFFNKEVELEYEPDAAEGGGEIRYQNEVNDGTFVDERITTTDSNFPGQVFDDPTNSQNFQNISKFTEQAPTTQDVSAYNGVESVVGLGKVYYAREPFLNIPSGFYKAISDGAQPWFERIRTQEDNSVFKSDTFPHLLFNSSPGNWTLNDIPWTPRVSGPASDNPGPSVMSGGAAPAFIKSMAAWRNRLWFAVGQTLFTSRFNDYFDLWINDTQNLVDEDPIDIIGGSNRITELTSLVPFSSFLFANSSNKVQFEVQGSQNFISPTNASMAATSFFGTTPEAEPVTLGSALFFLDANRLYVYFPSTKEAVNQATEVSYQARDYLPKNPKMLTAIEFLQSMVWLDGDTERDLYFYSSRFQGQDQITSAFFKWSLDESWTVRHMFMNDTYLNLVVEIDDKLWLVKSDLEILNQDPLLDCGHWVTGTFNPTDGKTTFTSKVPLSLNPLKRVAVLGPDWDTSEGTVLLDQFDQSRYTVEVNGDYTGAPVFIGNSYEMRATLSRQYVRDEQNNIIPGSLMLKNMVVEYDDSGSFDVEIVRSGRETSKSVTTAENFRVNGRILLGEKQWVDGSFVARVQGDAYNTQISIVSDYPEPIDITQVEITTNFQPGFRTSNNA